jgi:pimeloyl-CoA synthetase
MSGDPLGKGPVMVELNHTLAELLARLCVELGTEDVTGVMSRALGLLDMVQHTKRHGGRLCFVNERGDLADVVF